MSEQPRLVAHLPVFALPDGDDGVQCVMRVQDSIGRIVGGGTCKTPLAIELTPLYDAAPALLAACKQFVALWPGVADGSRPAHPDVRMAVNAARAAIAQAEDLP